MQEWSNSACLGYIIKGLQDRGKSEEEIKDIVSAVRGQFDWVGVEEAREIYNKSSY